MKGQALRPEIIDQARALRAERLSYSQIAKRLGFSKTAVAENTGDIPSCFTRESYPGRQPRDQEPSSSLGQGGKHHGCRFFQIDEAEESWLKAITADVVPIVTSRSPTTIGAPHS